MIRMLFAVFSLCLIAPNGADAQVSENTELEARALRDLGEYVRDARLRYSLPGSSNPRSVDLIGPPRLQTVGAPVCVISVLTLYYEEADIIGSGLEGPVQGVSARTMYRLAAENDGAAATSYPAMLSACENAARQSQSRWFTAEYDTNEWSLMYAAVWNASGFLHALRHGEASFDDVNLVEFRARGEEHTIRALQRASAQELSFVRIGQCPDAADGACRRADLSLGNGLVLRVTLRRVAQGRWSATEADALWSGGVY